MPDRVKEKLVELLETPNKAAIVRSMNGVPFTDDDTAESIEADFLIANGVTVQEWISVKDRLPEKHGETYLCLYTFPNSKESFPYCLHWHAYGSNGFVDGPHFSDEGIAGMKVTHWMPLPQPPKGE